MEVIEIKDKLKIEAYLRADLYLHIYEIGDLDPFFWNYTRWYAAEDKGEIQALFLVYTAEEVPVLLALEDNNLAAAAKLLDLLLPKFAKRFYCHVSLPLKERLLKHCEVTSHGVHLKMKLKKLREGVLKNDIEILDKSHLKAIEELYRASYPENWFDKRMLETGQYLGLYEKQRLVSIAGVHVYSKAYKVAALGNITTHPEYRDRGFGTTITAHLCKKLQGEVKHVGLNVKADNDKAIKCYLSLGFETHTQYEELMVTSNRAVL